MHQSRISADLFKVVLESTAVRYEACGRDTERRLDEWSLPASSGSDGGGKPSGSHSDPVLAAVENPEANTVAADRLRWRRAHQAIRVTAAAHGVPFAAAGMAQTLRGLAGIADQLGPQLRSRVAAYVDDIAAIMARCTPTTEEPDRPAPVPVSSCLCCERTGQTMEGALCKTCSQTRRRHVDSGRFVDDATFLERRRGAIARGEALPDSPLYRTASMAGAAS